MYEWSIVTIYHIQFSESEFKQYVGKVWDQNANKGMKKAKIPEMNSLPNSFDWREHGAVTEVKNQVRSITIWLCHTVHSQC